MIIEISFLFDLNDVLTKMIVLNDQAPEGKENNPMSVQLKSEGWNDLVEELKQLEAFFPLLGISGEEDELREEVAELEALISTAGVPEDEHSQRALMFLRSELAKKRGFLDKLM
ncbi:MAG: hypothetical protein AB7O21_09170 [Gammaproteobacteria bacterium]